MKKEIADILRAGLSPVRNTLPAPPIAQKPLSPAANMKMGVVGNWAGSGIKGRNSKDTLIKRVNHQPEKASAKGF